jgi:hypothetical protein
MAAARMTIKRKCKPRPTRVAPIRGVEASVVFVDEARLHPPLPASARERWPYPLGQLLFF